MLTLYFTPGACSLAPHIVLEESGEKYQTQLVDMAKGEQRSDSYLKINPQGRVPALRLDNGESLTYPTIKEAGLKAFHGYLKQIDGMLAAASGFASSTRCSMPTVWSSMPGASAASCRCRSSGIIRH